MSLEGDIKEIDLISRLVELGREQFTGAIRFENDGIIKIIYFKGGDILSASTNDRADSIDEILLRAGKVTREHVKQALAKRKESETLGDALLNLGFITRKELTWARRVQAIGVIRSLNAWSAGSYTIVSDYLPKREEGTLFPLPQIIVELIVTDQDRQKFDRVLDGGNMVFAKSPDFDDLYRRLGLNEEAARIASAVDGHRSAGEVAAAVESEVFNVYKLLHAFHILGLLQPAEKLKVIPEFSHGGDEDLASAGVADAADLWTSPDEVEAVPEPGFNPEPEPSFQFDAEPGSSFQFDTEPEPAHVEPPAAPEPVIEHTDPMPSWEEPTSSPAEASPMPSWDDELPPPAVATAMPPENGWGFDDAQLETARRAAEPVATEEEQPAEEAVAREAEPNHFRNIVILIVLAIVLTFGGYASFLWWKGRQPAQSAPPVAAAPTRHPVIRPRRAATVTTGTIATSGATSTSTGLLASTASGNPGAGGGAGAGAGTTNPVTGSTATIASGVTSPASPATTTARPATTSATTTHTATTSAATTSAATTTAGAKPMTITPAAPPVKPTPTPSRAVKATPQPAAPPVTSTTPRLERNAAGNPVITNTGAGSTTATTAGNDATRRKYDAMAQQAASGASGNFTIQFELVCQTSSLATATKVGGNQVWFVPTSYRNQSCYRVFWGHYGTRDAATAAIHEIPSSLRGPSPTVVAVPR
jgi:septal ring-binding cell division protein DamX